MLYGSSKCTVLHASQLRYYNMCGGSSSVTDFSSRENMEEAETLGMYRSCNAVKEESRGIITLSIIS